jgi:quinol monooxygenase YgiN
MTDMSEHQIVDSSFSATADSSLKRDKKGEFAMSKLVIMGTIEVLPGKRDQVVSLLTAHGTRCLKDEPGTLEFKVLIPRDDDSKILICEVYQDDAAFEVHRNASKRPLHRPVAQRDSGNGRQGHRDEVHTGRVVARRLDRASLSTRPATPECAMEMSNANLCLFACGRLGRRPP